MKEFTAVILAAGEGVRMKSNIPKVMHKVCGKPMLTHVINAAKGAGANKVIIVVGKDADKIKEAYINEDVEFVIQEKQMGTGHALMQAENAVKNSSHIVVLCGDMPLVTAESIKGMVDFHEKEMADATVMTAKVSDPTGYGRIIREGKKVLDIREHKDATPEELKINEVNAAFYCFNTVDIFASLAKIQNDNSQKEYYLTDAIKILNQEDKKVVAFELSDPEELNGINDRKQLAKVQSIMQKRIIDKLMEDGVTFINPDTCMVDCDVKIGKDTTIYPGAMLEGSTTIGENCSIIGPCRIIDTTIGNDCEIVMTQINKCVIEDGVKIGPYTNLRPDCRLSQKVKVGDFVELKNAKVGEGTKIPHLSYVGDAVLGKHINIGCGTVFVNYDGYKKHQTVVEDNVFIGCNSNLIAPVTLKAGSFIAAGSTITDDVPENALGIARARQVNKTGWVIKRKQKFEGGISGNGNQP